MENTPAVVGLGVAAGALAAGGSALLRAESARSLIWTTALLDGLTAVDGVTAYGDTGAEGRVPHLVCFGIERVEAEAVLLGLDQAGVAAHSGSACSSEALEPSPVLVAMGVDGERSLRLSVGWNTSDEDVAAAIDAFPGIVARLRDLAARPS
jgi:cysteine desulfurase